MEKKEYQLDAFLFQNKEDYDRAVKEKETITYLKANSNPDDMKALLRIYNRSVEKESFRTVIGMEYMNDIRKRLVESGLASEEALAPIPVQRSTVFLKDRDQDQAGSGVDLERQVKRYKDAYEAASVGKTIKNLVIVMLVLVIFAMILITYKTRYSVFTYFTNYKEKMRNEVIDEYEGWQAQLEQKEQELKEREAGLEQTE